MPIYEYECTSCKQNVDILQKISDAPRTICPHCNEPTLVKLVSAAGFHLKGSGWYATDFKKNTAKEAKADTTPSSPKKENKTSTTDSSN